MEHASQRIRLRARLRCKELLDKLDPMSREKARERIGIKPRENSQLSDALKVAPPLRAAMIDASPPATLSKLARVGNPPPVYAPQPGTGSAPGFAGVLAFWKLTSIHEAQTEAAKIDPSDAPYVHDLLMDIEKWLTDFERSMPRQAALKRG